MPVHNHGTEEGKGLACRETLVNGKLKGECLRQPEDLRARIGRIVRAAVDSREVCYPVALEVADAVIRDLDLENRITSAICGYAGSEQMALTHHDPNRGGTEFDALTRLISEAPKIARYAMRYRPDWKADDE